jgi:hypothetical protein
VAHVTTLNTICPYYTMYPLHFPLRLLQKKLQPKEWVLDPFCGRGTTNFAARLLGLPSIGVDSSPIAVAIATAKLIRVSAASVVEAATTVLSEAEEPRDVPKSEFWRWAYHEDTLKQLCCLREALMTNCGAPERIMLRAILLGALHGPMSKRELSYFSNQSPRTFAPKPAYAVRFWRQRGLYPQRVHVLSLIRRKAIHYLETQPDRTEGFIVQADSRLSATFDQLLRFSCIITSPPYYGLRTYIPDQWLRHWFLGGPSEVVYQQPHSQMTHSSPEEFVDQLSHVWRNAAGVCRPQAGLVCRFGGIHERKVEPLDLIKTSFRGTGWRITTIRDAGSALKGKRQAIQFGKRTSKRPRPEYDVYARLTG